MMALSARIANVVSYACVPLLPPPSDLHVRAVERRGTARAVSAPSACTHSLSLRSAHPLSCLAFFNGRLGSIIADTEV